MREARWPAIAPRAAIQMVDDFVEECLLPLRQTLLELLLEERDQVLRVGRHVGEHVEAARNRRELVAQSVELLNKLVWHVL